MGRGREKTLSFHKRGTSYLVVLGAAVAAFFLMRGTFTFASASQTTIPHRTAKSAERLERKFAPDPPQWSPPLRDPSENNQLNNQYFQGILGGSSLFFQGDQQGNTGNQGQNQGFNQDNGGNSRNQVSNLSRPIRDQINTQTNEEIGTGGGGSSHYLGFDQGNSGNQGYNQGNNLDSSSNGGNQVNNQGNTIGVQINGQRNLVKSNSNGNQASNPDGTTSYSPSPEENSGEGGTEDDAGYDQGTHGNQGFNLGNNQDNSGNSGSEVNNQTNTIGTQVNGPGSQVDNHGSIIEHQINYIILDRPRRPPYWRHHHRFYFDD